MLILTLLTEHPGILNFEDAYKFKVTVTNINGDIILEMTIDAPDYISSTNKIVNIQLSAGEYYIIAFANNRYGTSDASNEVKVTVLPTLTTSIQPSQSSVPTEKTSKCFVH